jgi:hypothetical protein
MAAGWTAISRVHVWPCRVIARMGVSDEDGNRYLCSDICRVMEQQQLVHVDGIDSAA